MGQNSRSQVRLILEDADAKARRAVATRIKAIYAKHAATGLLKSGATIKSVAGAVEEIAADFITRCTDAVAAVAKDTEAFAMIQQTVEGFLHFTKTKVDAAAQTAVGFPRGTEIFEGTYKAADKLFNDSRRHLIRQLEIQRFIFTVPQSQPATAPLAAPSIVTVAKNRGGKPLADHWDQMWAAIAVMLYTGDLKVKTQADIERAMKDWLSAHDFDVGDTAVRGRARKLWQELERSA